MGGLCKNSRLLSLQIISRIPSYTNIILNKWGTFEQMVQSGTQSGNQENRASKCVTFEQMVQFGTQSGNQENRASKCVTFDQMVQFGTQSGNQEIRASKCVTFSPLKCKWRCSAKASQRLNKLNFH